MFFSPAASGCASVFSGKAAVSISSALVLLSAPQSKEGRNSKYILTLDTHTKLDFLFIA